MRYSSDRIADLLNPRAELEKYYNTVLQILLTKLQSARTEAFALRFVRFYHFFSANLEKGFGADRFIAAVDQVQEG